MFEFNNTKLTFLSYRISVQPATHTDRHTDIGLHTVLCNCGYVDDSQLQYKSNLKFDIVEVSSKLAKWLDNFKALKFFLSGLSCNAAVFCTQPRLKLIFNC